MSEERSGPEPRPQNRHGSELLLEEVTVSAIIGVRADCRRPGYLKEHRLTLPCPLPHYRPMH